MRILRGWFGEKKTTFYMWLSLDGNVYRRFHDVIIPSSNGTTQIDHLLVSPYGLFIVETKNIKGWIFGSASQANWTQSLYGKKYSFQNPIRQTFRQKKILSEYLGLNEPVIHSSITVCPKCGSTLVERTAKKGPNAGLKIYGCENYPRCRFTRNT